MKTRLLLLALVCSLTLPGAMAQSGAAKAGEKKAPAAKAPADVAADEFYRVRNEKGPKLDQAGFQKLIGAGMAYLTKFPAHGRVAGVVQDLANYGTTMTAKEHLPYRSSYLAFLKYEILNEQTKEGVSEAVATVLAALDAAAADFGTRETANRENLDGLREKIDKLATMPGGARFLVERERSYFDILNRGFNPAVAEAHLKKLLGHSDKAVAAMARQELNIVEIRKEPYALKFTALDGKEVDFAQLRGKVVALYFWSTTNAVSTKNFPPLVQIHNNYKKRGFEVVTVSFDKESDREKVVQYVKANRINMPVYFDGKGAKNDFAPKLNITREPAFALFDQKGILFSRDLPANQLEFQVKRMLGIK